MTRITKFMHAFVLLMFALVLAVSPAPARAHSGLTPLTGGLTTVQVPCDTLCTQGVLTGGLAGQLDFTMVSMTETDVPNVFTYVGSQTITTASGTLSGTDYGIWNIATGEFVDFMTFTATTGAYAGRTGTLIIVGKFDPVTGVGSSTYKAVLIP